MEKYYFDTSVWLAYLDKKEFYHEEAVKWFQKISEPNNILVISSIIDFELKRKSRKAYEEYKKLTEKLAEKGKVKTINPSKEERLKAYKNAKQTGLGYGDLLHIIIIKNHGLKGVTADITHWPKIARILETEIIYITEVCI